MNELKPQYLCITSALFVIPVIIYIFKNEKNLEKNILACFVFLGFIFSQLFWSNPIQHSFIHKTDANIAKITSFLCIAYVLFYKNLSSSVLFLYLLLGMLAIIAFYRSDCFSLKEWCCEHHIMNHGLLHICGVLFLLYVFL